MQKPTFFKSPTLISGLAAAILGNGAVFVSFALARMPQDSTTQQTPDSSSQKGSTSGTQQSQASTPASQSPSTEKQAPSTAAKKPGTTQSQGTYHALRPSDGIDFAAYADKVELSSGGRPSGVLKRFALVGKDLQLIELELADTNFVDGHIKTKLFGDVIVTSTNLLQFQYRLTESQIRKIKSFLATQPTKANATQAVASGAQQAPVASRQPATPAAAASLFLGTDKDKVSYAIGMNIGKSLKRDGVDVEPTILLQAMKDELGGGKALLTDQEAQATLVALQTDLRKKMELQQQQLAETNKKEGEAFLAANKTKEGVVTLPSGLQYKILQEGTGPKPAATDTVLANYRGTLLNGTEFDSSYKRGQPTPFAVGQIIKGWSEALQLMPVGSKWQLFIPSDLAYGARGAGRDIGPNSTLIFEVELVSIQPKVAATPAPAPTPPPNPVSAPAPQSPAPTPNPTPNPTPPTPPPAPKPTPTPTPPPSPTPTPKP